MIKLFIADDHQIIIDGLKLLIERENDMEVVGEALDGEAALQVLSFCVPDIAILDIDMPKIDGTDVTKWIIEKSLNIKILILSMFNEEEFIRDLIEAGISGYILKNRGSEELVGAIREIHGGGQYFGKSVTDTLIRGIKSSKKKPSGPQVPITKREIEILKLIVEGMTTPQIAQGLCIAHSTVETHRRNLIDKTGVANSKSLITWAIRNGYFD